MKWKLGHAGELNKSNLIIMIGIIQNSSQQRIPILGFGRNDPLLSRDCPAIVESPEGDVFLIGGGGLHPVHDDPQSLNLANFNSQCRFVDLINEF